MKQDRDRWHAQAERLMAAQAEQRAELVTAYGDYHHRDTLAVKKALQRARHMVEHTAKRLAEEIDHIGPVTTKVCKMAIWRVCSVVKTWT